jgi:hypothetical protein
MRTIISIATMEKTPAHQWQQRHCNEGNNTSLMASNKGDDINDDDNAIAMRATMPA